LLAVWRTTRAQRSESKQCDPSPFKIFEYHFMTTQAIATADECHHFTSEARGQVGKSDWIEVIGVYRRALAAEMFF
jgi:hypothetical protein